MATILIITALLLLTLIVLRVKLIAYFIIKFIGEKIMDQITAAILNLTTDAAGIIQELKATNADLTSQLAAANATIATLVDPNAVVSAINNADAQIKAI
jgi:hypothetical protein